MPRKTPPSGYLTATDAINMLKQRGVITSNAMFYKYISAGKLHQYGPETRSHKYYELSEIENLIKEEQEFYGQLPNIPKDLDATFTVATPEDMDGIATLATQLFGRSIDADRRREWLAKEPRGNYVVKRKDGTIVAYFYMQAIKHDRLVDYQRGKIRGWDITEDDILPFEPGKPLEIMLGGIGSDPSVSSELRSHYVSVLLRGVKRELEQLGEQGITLSRIYAYSNTLDGIYMCLEWGMKVWERPRRVNGIKRCTFYLDMDEADTFIFESYKKALAKWQNSK